MECGGLTERIMTRIHSYLKSGDHPGKRRSYWNVACEAVDAVLRENAALGGFKEEKFTSTNTASLPCLCEDCTRRTLGSCRPNTNSRVTACEGYTKSQQAVA